MIIETLGDKVRMITIRGKNGVDYSVEQKEGEEWVCVWSEQVLFGQTHYKRPSGAAFQQAAKEQERIAEQYKAKLEGNLWQQERRWRR
jgi:hypothetical protein